MGETIRAGEYVAYWAVISVFGYYYEVIARFVVQFADQLAARKHVPHVRHANMLACAYAYQVRTSTCASTFFYVKFSTRGKALADIIYVGVFLHFRLHVVLHRAGCFAMDSFNPGGTGEVSFTEWGVQYWPVKLMMPIGAALLALQGLSKLMKDIVILTRGRA